MFLTNLQTAPVKGASYPAGVSRLDYVSSLDQRRDWALLWTQEQSADWLVCIHGHGSTGDQLYTRPDLRDQWLPAFRQAGLNIITPHLRGNAWMGPAAVDDLTELLDYLRLNFGARRFILASGSMGGTSNLIYAALRPRDVAAVVALCPATDLSTYHRWCLARPHTPVLGQIAAAIQRSYGGTPDAIPEIYGAHSPLLLAQRLTMPLFLAHGTSDAIIPIDGARELSVAIGQRATFRYEELPAGHHDSPLPLMPRALAWVLK